MNTNDNADAEENWKSFKRPSILWLVPVLVDGPGWGCGSLVGCAQRVRFDTWSFWSNLLINLLLLQSG